MHLHAQHSTDCPSLHAIDSSTAVGTTTTSCQLHRDCVLVHPKARQGKQGPDVVHLSQEDVKQQVEGIINTKRLNTLLEQVKGCPVAVDCVLLHAADRVACNTDGFTGRDVLAEISKTASAELIGIVRKKSPAAEMHTEFNEGNKIIRDGHDVASKLRRQFNKLAYPPFRKTATPGGCKSRHHHQTGISLKKLSKFVDIQIKALEWLERLTHPMDHGLPDLHLSTLGKKWEDAVAILESILKRSAVCLQLCLLCMDVLTLHSH
ncbi:hypothetical protein BC831DRAFT_59755 [Entophlyctis helioformis]|nr:hypothetical protein BC831DRAFT_59755 [Entophlyctis helioformis]